jgi:hypothetical protein
LRIDRSKLKEAELPMILEAIGKTPGKRRLILEIVNPMGVALPLILDESILVGDEQTLRTHLEPWLLR